MIWKCIDAPVLLGSSETYLHFPCFSTDIRQIKWIHLKESVVLFVFYLLCCIWRYTFALILSFVAINSWLGLGGDSCYFLPRGVSVSPAAPHLTDALLLAVTAAVIQCHRAGKGGDGAAWSTGSTSASTLMRRNKIVLLEFTALTKIRVILIVFSRPPSARQSTLLSVSPRVAQCAQPDGRRWFWRYKPPKGGAKMYQSVLAAFSPFAGGRRPHPTPFSRATSLTSSSSFLSSSSKHLPAPQQLN